MSYRFFTIFPFPPIVFIWLIFCPDGLKTLLHNRISGRLGCSESPRLQTCSCYRYIAHAYFPSCISCIVLCLCQGFPTSQFSWFQVTSTLWVVLESSQCRRSSICYAQFKLLAEQHNFRTYLSATQLRFMEMIGDVCFHPNLHIAWHFWQSESTGRRVPFARDSCCTWQLRL